MEAILQIAVLAIVPLIFLSMAGLLPWVSGVLVVALEGFMLLGAFVGAVVSSLSGYQSVGFLAAIGAGLVIGAVMAYVMVYLRADQVVAGIAFNIAAVGATSFFFALIESHHGKLTPVRGGTVSVPFLSDLPVVGVVFSQHWLAILAPILVVALAFVLFRTGVGLRLRAVGDFSAGAHAAGVNVGGYRFWATAASGALAALGGAFLAIVSVGDFTENMTAGRGYIALTIVILGRWKPWGAAAGALLFAVAEGLSVVWQGFAGLPSQLFLSIPYLLTLLAVTASARASHGPVEEGRPMTVWA
ncbi:MAG: Ribose transport system, permease protein RbsC [Frankiales bacterium]|jgi:ABC-type uncharacterized transport system permease subunit|nr:Ribose transport system, permease protein RbsC [Frankiales bacterium]